MYSFLNRLELSNFEFDIFSNYNKRGHNTVRNFYRNFPKYVTGVLFSFNLVKLRQNFRKFSYFSVNLRNNFS